MKLIVDVEADDIEKPQNIWCIVAKEVDTEKEHILRHPIAKGQPLTEWYVNKYLRGNTLIGHHIIGYDVPVLNSILGAGIDYRNCIDTLVASRLVHGTRDEHSLESWGPEVGVEKQHSKVDQSFFQQWSQELEDRCVSDARINWGIYRILSRYIHSPLWAKAFEVENEIAEVCRELHENGFGFDRGLALELKAKLEIKLRSLDDLILSCYTPKSKLVKEIIPRLTQYGTLNKSDFRWVKDGDLSPYSADAPFSRIEFVPFNPASTKQVLEKLNEAGWQPTERTKGYTLAVKNKDHEKVKKYHDTNTGWRVTAQENLNTLPETAPVGARKLAERIMIASRISDLDEWLELAKEDENGIWRIHGNFNGVGAWTQRMSHYRPNTANIATEKPQDTPEIAQLNRDLRSLWIAPRKRLLVGVDADQIQLRVLAHYMQEPAFIKALVEGDKEKGTDVHSLNVQAIGPACKGRRDAKTFIYSWLLGAGVGRVAEILGCSFEEGKDARTRFIEYYPGLKRVREVDIRRDARRGYFQGFDGRFVRIWGGDEDERRHFCLGGYLQAGEAVVMKMATILWRQQLRKAGIWFRIVNFVHDEWQIEIEEDYELGRQVAHIVSGSLATVGADLGLHCPMKGSTRNDHGETIGKNWLQTH